MNADDVKVGRYLRVPAGADMTRSTTYYCQVTEVAAVHDGFVHVRATKTNKAGDPSRRFTKREGIFSHVHVYAILNLAEISLHRPAIAEDWYKRGAEVVELEYHGHGHYSAERVKVVKVTQAMVFTSSGRRFWRKSTGLVGQTSKRIAGVQIDPIRIVRPDNVHAVAYFEGKR